MSKSPEANTQDGWTGWTPARGFPLPGKPETGDDRIGFLLRLGRSLHDSGYAAHRLEEAMTLAADQLGLEAQFYSAPTTIMASFGPQDDQRTFLLRVDPQDTNLARLALVDEVTRMVLNQELTPLEGSRRLEQIEKAPPVYPPWITVLAFALSSGAATGFLGGGWHEMAASAVIGFLIGLFSLVAGKNAKVGRVFEPGAALIASIVAASIAHYLFPVAIFLATLGGVIILVPGYTLTTAMTELSTRHLSSGTARFMAAMITLIGLIFGIALGGKIAWLLFHEVQDAPITALPSWVLPLSLLVAPMAFAVLLRAHPRDLGWIITASVMAYFGAFYGSQVLGPELGAFAGAFVSGLASAWYAKLTNRPSQVVLTPALLLLVPGSVGLRSFASLLDNNYQLGIEGGFRMILIAISLVAGTLIAAIVSPRRKLMRD